MLLKQIIYSILNINILKNNIIDKKKIKLNILSNGNYRLQKVLQFKEKKISLSSTKTRKMVQGGGKKPYKQKGTGKARIGSIRSPLHRGGGIIFGPKYQLIYKKLNKKERQLLFQTLLYNKRFNFLIFKSLNNNLKLLLKQNSSISTLIILETKTIYLQVFSRNFKNCNYVLITQLNINHFFNKKRIIISCIAFNLLVLHFLD